MKDSFIFKSNVTHLSFDFWDTLAFSNPKFKYERTKLISKYCGQSFIDIDECFHEIGKKYNLQQQSSNIYIKPIDLLQKAIEKLNTNSVIDINLIYEDILILFQKNKPILNPFCKDFIIKCIVNNIKLSILSNTAFIPGKMIKDYLIAEFGENVFSFYLFSDETKIAKPNIRAFELCYQNINTVHSKMVSKTAIVHIGDNYLNDYEAAKTFGFQSHIIKKDEIEI